MIRLNHDMPNQLKIGAEGAGGTRGGGGATYIHLNTWGTRVNTRRRAARASSPCDQPVRAARTHLTADDRRPALEELVRRRLVLGKITEIVRVSLREVHHPFSDLDVVGCYEDWLN